MIEIRQRFSRGNLDEVSAYASATRRGLYFRLRRIRTGAATKASAGMIATLISTSWRKSAKALGFYWKGFGFHSMRREAITAVGSIIGIGQAMNLAGHSSVDMSLLYTLGTTRPSRNVP
jgi:hypothetical protein